MDKFNLIKVQILRIHEIVPFSLIYFGIDGRCASFNLITARRGFSEHVSSHAVAVSVWNWLIINA